jgi:hypothetical protein
LGGTRFLEDDGDVFALDGVELNGAKAIDGIDGIAAGDDDGDGQGHGERGEHGAPTTAVEIPDDHARRRGE